MREGNSLDLGFDDQLIVPLVKDILSRAGAIFLTLIAHASVKSGKTKIVGKFRSLSDIGPRPTTATRQR